MCAHVASASHVTACSPILYASSCRVACTADRHFRSNHSGPFNIAVHLFGLVHLAMANFALWATIDEMLGWQHSLSLLTLLGWCWLLLVHTSMCPGIVRALACALTVFAFWCRHAVRARVFSAVAVFELPLLAAIWRFGDGNALPTLSHPLICLAAILPGLLAIALHQHHASMQHSYSFHGCLSAASVRLPLNVVAMIALAYSSIHPFAKAANCYWAAPLGCLLALSTDQPAFAFHGSGFIASLLQGVAHVASGEKANLPELARRTGGEKAGDEHAHTAFFPCLILHSAYESLCG